MNGLQDLGMQSQEDIERHISTLLARLTEKDEHIDALAAEVAELQAKLTETETVVMRTTAMRDDYSKRYYDTATECRSLQAKLARVEEYVETLRRTGSVSARNVAFRLHYILDPEELAEADVTEPEGLA